MGETCKHEVKVCPRCGCDFECKVGDIINCQCHGIRFTEEGLSNIGAYEDCLCRACLEKLNAANSGITRPSP